MDIFTLIAVVTLAEVQAQILGYAQGAQLPITAWVRGGAGQQMIAVFARAIEALYGIVRQLGMSIFLDTATDPGDTDGNAEARGYLSALGEGTFGTIRPLSTFANGSFTLTNNSGAPITFGPEELDLENATLSPAQPYRNTYDPGLYTGPGRTITIANGSSATFPIKALNAGTVANAAPGDVTMVTTIAGTSGTNPTAIIGQDRMPAPTYRRVCRLAAGRLSPGGVSEAYEWLAFNLNTDGTIAETDDGKTRINVNRVRVSEEAADGTVTCYFASPSGPVDAGEFVTLTDAIDQYITPNAVTTSLNNVANSTINITYTAKTRGGDPVLIEASVEEWLMEWFPTIPISGYDYTGVSGTLYVDSIKLEIGRADRSLYDVDVTIPALDATLGAGITAALGTITATITPE